MSDRITRSPSHGDDAMEPERYELHGDSRPAFTTDRRQFLHALGGGLAVFCLTPEAIPQEARRNRRQEPEEQVDRIAAWLHIGADGAITACTGKVELGQNTRTSLSQAVADELRVPIESIDLIMGDTDRVPYDPGTFGSRSTPTMAPRMRRAAAAAREILIRLAAERLGVDSAGLKVADGKILDPATGRSLGFGELTAGRELVESIEADVPVTLPSEWTVAGRSVPKVNGSDFVTGRHRFASDMVRPGMLRAKVLRPPSFGATLASLDTAAAQAIPGVVVVRDGDFVGVAAPDELTAEEAIVSLQAKWNEPPLASFPTDETIYDHFKNQVGESRRRREPAATDLSDIEKALDTSACKMDARYTIAYIAHTPLEPRAAVAEWDGDRLTVWTGTQRPFGVRSELAAAFRIPEERVRVLMPDMGSGYGGKHTGDAAIEAARIAKAAGRPVKLIWSREEEFTWAYFRPAGLIETRAGLAKDGTLLAWEFHNYNSGGAALDTPYEVPLRWVQFHEVQSPLRQGSYRALAATANHFARESFMDELAHQIVMDPLEFRAKNLRNERLLAVLKAAAERFGWGRTRPGEGHGFGLACGIEKGGYVATCAEVALDQNRPRGRDRVCVIRAVTAFECGAIVNPDHLRNQAEGMIVQGLGGALFERIRFANGKIANGRFAQYPLPRFHDAPEIDIVLLNRPDLPSAGAGETPLVGIAPAVANAIFAATGKRIRSMPLEPDGIG